MKSLEGVIAAAWEVVGLNCRLKAVLRTYAERRARELAPTQR
jgi:hypothetical protein